MREDCEERIMPVLVGEGLEWDWWELVLALEELWWSSGRLTSNELDVFATEIIKKLAFNLYMDKGVLDKHWSQLKQEYDLV